MGVIRFYVLVLACTFSCNIVFGKTEVPYRVNLEVATLVRLTEAQAIDLHIEFENFIKEMGFSEKVIQKAREIETRSLVKLVKIDDATTQRADWERLRRNVTYWRGVLGTMGGIDQLEHFILKTRHSNPFHPFNIELNRWESYLNMMLRWEVFTSLNGTEARSFRNYVIAHKWLEGVQTSQKRSPEFWERWSEVFERSGMKPQFLGETIYEQVMKSSGRNGSHNDGIQSLYLGLTEGLLETFSRYSQYLNPKLIGKIFTTNIIQVSMVAEDIREVFEKYDRLEISQKAKSEDILREIEFLVNKFNVDKIEDRRRRRHGGGRCVINLK